MISIARRLRRQEDGYVMLVAITLLVAFATLVTLVLTVGSHVDKATGRGRNWVQALHVAESGVDRAIARLQDTGGAFSGAFSGSTEDGGYAVTVTKLARNQYQIDSKGDVNAGGQLAASRSIRVTMGPPASFKNALDSATTIDAKDNDGIIGDVWANESVVLESGTIATGSITAATGYIILKNGARVTKDARSGGYNPATEYAVELRNNARVDGSVKSSVTAPPDPIQCGGENPGNYKVRLDSGAVVAGNVTTWGTVTGPGTVQGTVTTDSCTTAVAAVPLPTFTYSSSNYDAATLHEYGTPSVPSSTALADFQSYVSSQSSRISGTFSINQSGAVSQGTRVDLTGVTITGDTTIISNTPVFSNGTTDSTSNAIFVLISTYQPPVGATCDVNKDSSDCSIHFKNNFSLSGATAALAYAPYGPCAVKNNQEMNGAAYCQSILIKNNQSLTYDARLERIVGFGPTTLEVIRWLELKS